MHQRLQRSAARHGSVPCARAAAPPSCAPCTGTCRIIKWTLEHSTGGKAELQSLLESCTSALLKVPRYKSDQRYLRLWIQYVSGCLGRSRCA